MATVVQIPGAPPRDDTLARIFSAAMLQSQESKSKERQQQVQFALDLLLQQRKQEAQADLEKQKGAQRRELEEFKQDEILNRVLQIEQERQKGARSLEELKASQDISLEAVKQKNRLALEERKAQLDVAKDTETQRDVSSIIATTPALRDADLPPQEKRDRARQILRNEDVVLNQLEQDLKRFDQEGNFLGFISGKDQLVFESARRHVRDVMAEESDPGKAVEEAKRRAEQSVENLEFLPNELQERVFTRAGLSREPQAVLQDMQQVVEMLMQSDLVEQLQAEDMRFDDALEMLRKRVDVGDAAAKALRERVLGKPQEEEEEDEGGTIGLLNRLFGG